MNLAEIFVSKVCGETFLSLWGFPNPVGKKGKEFCDFLAVCDPYVIIFSVKHIQIKDSGNQETDDQRWIKRAIEDSVKQIYGAERFINSGKGIFEINGNVPIILPDVSNRKIFRVAVSIGREDKFPLQQGDFEQGFVHVLDERSFDIILRELDTITDLVEYLEKKESFFRKVSTLMTQEEDLLGYYISNLRTFPEDADTVVFENDIWDGLRKNPQYIKKKEDDRISYVWDKLIETFRDTFDVRIHSNIETLPELEEALRIMAKESRLARRILGEHFREFTWLPRKPDEFASRLIQSELNPEVVYIIVTGPGERREERRNYLGLKCFVARGEIENCKTVVGIATEPYLPGADSSFDLNSYYTPEWTEEMANEAEIIKNEYGFMKNPKYRYGSTKEFPDT